MREKATRSVSPFLAWGDFHARSRFARPTIPEEKWATTRSLPRALWWQDFPFSLPHPLTSGYPRRACLQAL